MTGTFALIDPSTGQAFRDVPRATVDEVDAAIARAVAALEPPLVAEHALVAMDRHRTVHGAGQQVGGEAACVVAALHHVAQRRRRELARRPSRVPR